MVNVLDLPINQDGIDGTLRDYFLAMLEMLWEQGESFSGKRPLGNSGWETRIYEALQEGGFITDADDLAECQKGDQIIREAIRGLR